MDCSNSSITSTQAVQAFPGDPIEGLVPAFNVSMRIIGRADLYSNANLDQPENATDAQNAEIQGNILLTALYKTALGCDSDLTLTTCTIKPAIVEYDVTLTNNIYSLRQGTWQSDKLVSTVSVINILLC
jgi:hypothetical protein